MLVAALKAPQKASDIPAAKPQFVQSVLELETKADTNICTGNRKEKSTQSAVEIVCALTDHLLTTRINSDVKFGNLELPSNPK